MRAGAVYFLEKPVARELETRVNQTEADKKDAVQVINILPFNKPDH